MSFDKTVLKGEIKAINKLENEMYNLYVEILYHLKDNEIRKMIEIIKNQEEAHAKLISEIEVILSKELEM